VRIVAAQSAEHDYTLPPDTLAAIAAYFTALPRTRGFGNGRAARQLFQEMTQRQAQRLAEVAEASTDDLRRIAPEDVPVAGVEPV